MKIAIISLIGALAITACAERETWSAVGSPPQTNPTAERTLSYLNNVDEVRWYVVDGANAYVAFAHRPHDWMDVVRAATVSASRATGGTFTVWAISAGVHDRSWRPSVGNYFTKITARNGAVR